MRAARHRRLLAHDHPPQPRKAGRFPRQVDGHYLEGFYARTRSRIPDVHRQPYASANPGKMAACSYEPEKHFDQQRQLHRGTARAAAEGDSADEAANCVANGGVLQEIFGTCRTSAPSASRSRNPEQPRPVTPVSLGILMREIMRLNKDNFRLVRAGRVSVQQARRRLRGHPEGVAGGVLHGGRRRRRTGPQRPRHGDAQRAHCGRLAGGLYPERSARLNQQL